ncbi:UNVERIFIED_CONTAM: nas-15 [Trichonephila clavipes]
MHRECQHIFCRMLNEGQPTYEIESASCASHVGRVGGMQNVSLGKGCYSVGVMMHELMHTLGFVHEQNRPDRDDYITVLWENVKEGTYYAFKEILGISAEIRLGTLGIVIRICQGLLSNPRASVESQRS